jgi:hypothetical protein
MFDTIRRLETGLVCLVGACASWLGFAASRRWTQGSLVGDWLGACTLALAFGAIAFGIQRFARPGGKVATVGGLIVLLLLLVI